MRSREKLKNTLIDLKKEIIHRTHIEKELQRSNTELEQFASIASHDLKEPLRKIIVFGERLRNRNINNLDVKDINYLDRIQNASNRMQNLINGLLTYSRVTTQAQPFSEIDLNKIINEVLNDLEVTIKETNAQINIDTLPSIQADPIQIQQLFQNIIGNALKYRKPDIPPVINVTSKKNIDNLEISISDNGIGFEEKYVDKVFGIFQRLVTRSEYEGTGIGLSTCKKIVERHGGKIWAHSKLNVGTTFSFTIPIQN